uniref:Uncharacterized protein n=1 Tax=Arundo donax TaxID=35708 RepID=A0A0A9F9G1_ARUDO
MLVLVYSMNCYTFTYNMITM